MGFANTNAAPGLAFDNPVILFDRTGFPAGITQTATPIRVGQFQSLVLIITRDAAVVHTTSVELNWLFTAASGITGGSDRFNFVTTDLIPSLTRSLPIRGDLVNVRYTTGATPNNDRIQVVGSNRPYQAMALTMSDRTFLGTLGGGGFGIGPGAGPVEFGLSTSCFRYDGPADLFITGTQIGGAAGTMYLQITDLFTGMALADGPLSTATVGANFHYTLSTSNPGNRTVPRNSLSLGLTNFGATTVTFTVMYMASPEGT